VTAGSGMRHPAIAPLLEGRGPLSVERVEWAVGALQLSAYAGDVELPDELVTSVRCIVTVADRLLVTRTVHGDVSIAPGGRREPGETLEQTAIREVHEETGCALDPDSLERIGFHHFEHLAPVPDGHPFPHPDFLQVVFRGRAGSAPHGWVDTEGYVTQSWLIDPESAGDLALSAAERALLAVRAGT
jgi:8-oxo-dGTP pyrophosphatase MutT (NUDIX family)